jgi:putative two-component system response regulator
MNEKAKVLVVDDEDRNLRLMEAMLLPLGYQIVMARDGEEALERMRAGDVDLVLLDLMMPRMDGFEVARRLKGDDATRIVPIVIVTALGEVQDRVRALEAGADDFLTKPVEKTELRARVRSLLKVKAYNDHLRHYQQALEAAVLQRTRQVRGAIEKLKTASLETIYRLTRAAEYKDEDTGVHIQRMSNYAALIARTLGLREKTVESILYAAPMHDIGKIGIPDRILLKPGRLDAAEWEIMKTHTTIGARILEGSQGGFIRLGETIALTHHEKWDGSGYPRGLKGAGIPLAGRIVAIADVFDALTSKRPYKEAFSLEKSLEIIRAGRGGHFDPAVVDALLSALPEMRAIGEKYRD